MLVYLEKGQCRKGKVSRTGKRKLEGHQRHPKYEASDAFDLWIDNGHKQSNARHCGASLHETTSTYKLFIDACMHADTHSCTAICWIKEHNSVSYYSIGAY